MKKAIVIVFSLFIIISMVGCTNTNVSTNTSVTDDSGNIAENDVASVEEDVSEVVPQKEETVQEETKNSTAATNVETTEQDTKKYVVPNKFSIEGKWKSTGEYGFGQAQPGAIVVFDGANCNFFSPKDTYALYKEDNQYKLDCTSFMSTDTLSFKVNIIDNDHIDVLYGDKVTELKRVQ